MKKSNRKSPTINQDQLYFAEVKGICPLCGKHLMEKGKTKLVKQYEIAHIYPCHPTAKDMIVLNGINPPVDLECYENKIALCHQCHNAYDDDKTLNKYNELRSLKDSLLASENMQYVMGDYYLEDDIRSIVSKLLAIDDYNLPEVMLNKTALKIKEKLPDKYLLLREKIESNVTKYFQVVEEYFMELDSGKYENISIQIKSFYIKCSSITEDKEQVFDQIVDWIRIKTNNGNKIACEIVASFFVQKCEVFDAITK